MGLITETNAQYYSGQQDFPALTTTGNQTFNCTFNTNVFSAFNSTGVQVSTASNYIIYINTSPAFTGYVAQAESQSYVSDPINNIITLRGTFVAGSLVYVQLKQPAINANYGSYEYVSLTDVVNNFMVAYVGIDKLIPRVKRSDVIFHAKRGLQEFSYDTLKSVNSQELTIPPSLGVPIPQGYVNYVACYWVDLGGVQHPIYPVNNLTSNPTELPIQDALGVPTQNGLGDNNLAEQSLVEDRWSKQT